MGVDNVIVGSGRFPEMLFARVKSEKAEGKETGRGASRQAETRATKGRGLRDGRSVSQRQRKVARKG